VKYSSASGRRILGFVIRNILGLLRRVPFEVWAAALALVLSLPALWFGFSCDDHVHRAIFEGKIPVSRPRVSPYGLFAFVVDPKMTKVTIAFGVMPWWTSPDLQISFWRPLTELTHGLDAWLWPDSAIGAHAFSVGLYVCAAFLAARLYRELGMERIAAIVAAFVYACDDGHATAVGWIAARSGLVATVCVFACLRAHHRFWTNGARGSLGLACAWFAASLLSAEAGVAVCGYLVAYVLTYERTRRWISLVPYAAIGVVWASIYVISGFGTAHSGFYRNPLSTVSSCIEAMASWVVLMGSAFGGPPADIYAFLPPSLGSVHLAIAAALILAIAGYGVRPNASHAHVRFFAIGSALALVPSLGSALPQDRLLLIAHLGTAGIIGEFLAAYLQSSAKPRVLERVVAVLFFVLHLVVAPLLLPLRISSELTNLSNLFDRPAMMEPRSTTKLIVFVNPPIPIIPVYFSVLHPDPNPDPKVSSILLAPGLPGFAWSRESDRTLVVQGSSSLLTTKFDYLVRAPEEPMHRGQRIHVRGVVVEVREVDEQSHPTEVAFTFDRSVDDETIEFIVWRGTTLGSEAPPRIDQTQILPPLQP